MGYTLEWDDGLPERTEKEVQRELVVIGADLKQKSSEQAPIESGDLRGNCAVNVSKNKVKVGYSLPYALRQHEDLTLRHDRTDGYKVATGKNAGQTINMVAGGKAKYLEDPFNENVPKYINRLKLAVRRAMKK